MSVSRKTIEEIKNYVTFGAYLIEAFKNKDFQENIKNGGLDDVVSLACRVKVVLDMVPQPKKSSRYNHMENLIIEMMYSFEKKKLLSELSNLNL